MASEDVYRTIEPEQLGDVLIQAREERWPALVILGPELLQSEGWLRSLGIELKSVIYVSRPFSKDSAYINELLSHLTHLTRLYLINPGIVVDVSAIAKLINLTVLEIYRNQIGDHGAIVLAGLVNLTSLSLDINEIGDSGAVALAKLTNLISLNLGMNHISDNGVVAFAALINVTSLRLEYNRIGDDGAASLAKLTKLTSLSLRQNRISDYGACTLAKLTNLAFLDLSDNQMTDEGVKFLVNIPNLKTLYLDGNKLLRIPEELLDGGDHVLRIRKYYRLGDQEGKRQLNEAKLIVLGNEAVGKSALVDYLLYSKACGESQKTEGIRILQRIDVKKWNVERKDSQEPLRLNVWDFGGQEVLYETHKLFLTARSLYIIVLEARRENTEDAESVLHDWIRAIRNRSNEEVPLLIVVNKAEWPHDLRLDETRLKKDYPAIKAFVRTSCRSGLGIALLRQTIIDVVHRDMPHVRDWFPQSYFDVKEQANELAGREFVLKPSQFSTICTQHKIVDQQSQQDLLTLLDRIGVVIKHPDNMLLDPNWLTTAIYRILTHSEVVKANGIFEADNLGKLLRDIPDADKKYPQDRWKYIIDQTVVCGLSFELPDKPGSYLIPEQLLPNEPELNWYEDSLRFRYDYADLPKGLLSRFIVEMHRYLTDRRTAWANGVVLEVDSCKMLIRANRKSRQMLIFVTGPMDSRRGAIAVVRQGFAKVHTKFEDCKPKAMVPVYVPGQPDAAIEYQRLIEHERAGEEFRYILECGQKFEVKELLSGVGREPRAVSTVRNGEPSGGIRNRTTIHVSDSTPTPVAPSEPPKWWLSLIGPSAAAIVSLILLVLYYLVDDKRWMALVGVPALLFAVVYLVQGYFQNARTYWARRMAGSCLFIAGGLATIPTFKTQLESTWLGKFEFLIDSSPWLPIAFLLLAGFLFYIEYKREQNEHHKK